MSATTPQNPLPENPYAAPTARVSDAVENIEHELADRGRRLGAVILDGVIWGAAIGVFVGLSMLIAYQVGSKDAYAARASSIGIGIGMSVAVILLAAINLIWLHRYGQSIAKRWLGIKIVRMDGSRCGLARILFLRIIPLAFVEGIVNLLPPLGYLVRIADALFIFRDDRRCLHDLIADTKVVKV